MPTMGTDVPLGDGITMRMELNGGDGSEEFKRSLIRDKIDIIMERYGVIPGNKRNYHRFLQYNIEEKYRPMLTEHFKRVLRDDGGNYEDFDYGVVQMRYVELNGDRGPGLPGKCNFEAIVAREKVEIPEAYGPVEKTSQDKQVVEMMGSLMDRLSTFQASFEAKNAETAERLAKLESK